MKLATIKLQSKSQQANSQMTTKLAEFLAKPPMHDALVFNLNLNNLVEDKDLIRRAIAIWRELAEPYRLLFNAVLWDYKRLQAFVTGPSSVSDHHPEINGNFRHTIEVAEEVITLCDSRQYVNRNLAILSALLHDVGKAAEYERKYDGTYKLSLRGRLLGHKFTATEWVIEAVNKHKLKLPNNDYILLLHNLSAVANAPNWMGLRNPATPEARFLSIADQISGFDDFADQTHSGKAGWGKYHEHLPAKQIYFSGGV